MVHTTCVTNYGEVNAGWIPARPASVDQVHTKNNRHTPVMVYDDLIINKHSVVYYNINRSRPVTFLQIHTIIGAPVDRRRQTGTISPDRTLPSVRIIVPSSRMASSPLTIILQLISEQYMVELHSLPGRYTIFWYLADYVNTLSPI